MGIGAHRIRARVNATIGVIINNIGEAAAGRTGSLMKSFNPSAIGCRRP